MRYIKIFVLFLLTLFLSGCYGQKAFVDDVYYTPKVVYTSSYNVEYWFRIAPLYYSHYMCLDAHSPYYGYGCWRYNHWNTHYYIYWPHNQYSYYNINHIKQEKPRRKQNTNVYRKRVRSSYDATSNTNKRTTHYTKRSAVTRNKIYREPTNRSKYRRTTSPVREGSSTYRDTTRRSTSSYKSRNSTPARSNGTRISTSSSGRIR